MDDMILLKNRKQVSGQKTLDKLNDLLGWCQMSFNPAKICGGTSFEVAGKNSNCVRGTSDKFGKSLR